jgi:hypothetical protein
MRWENLQLGYSEFLHWLAQGDAAEFAVDHRWPGWRDDVAALSGDHGFFVAPPLWAEGPPMRERSRADVPMTELWTYAHMTMQLLEGVPPGSTVRTRFHGSQASDNEPTGPP